MNLQHLLRLEPEDDEDQVTAETVKAAEKIIAQVAKLQGAKPIYPTASADDGGAIHLRWKRSDNAIFRIVLTSLCINRVLAIETKYNQSDRRAIDIGAAAAWVAKRLGDV